MLSNLEGGDRSEETDRLFAYHQATKHTYHSVRANARFLDWQNQPNPFRTYEGAPLIALPPDPGFPEANAFATMAALARSVESAAPRPAGSSDAILLDANLLSRLLWHSMAVSAWKKVPGSGARYSLRVNPSSGNLHPTETYLALAGFAGLENGLYHYRADRHALELRSRGGWTRHLANALEVSWAANAALIVGLTSIFWREAWKYGDRAYRYCCHDLGHAMMSLLLAARALGLAGGVVTHFSDLRVACALGLAKSDEAPMGFLIFRAKPATEQIDVIPGNQFMGAPNELSREEVPYHLLLGMHRSTILPDPPGSLPRNPRPLEESPPLQGFGKREMLVGHGFSRAVNGSYSSGALAPESTGLTVAETPLGANDDASTLNLPLRDAPFAPTVRRRRSALDFDPRARSLQRNELLQLLDFATRDWHADWRGNFGGEIPSAVEGADLVTLYLYVHRVQDCDPGVYRWNRVSDSLELLHRANVQRMAAFLSLDQALAGNACFAVSMIGDLARAARTFGNRGYRLIHFEAGAIGQRLYVGAEALGFRATGIGAFYDDDVHRYLGFLDEGTSSADFNLGEAERTALVMLGSPASRLGTPDRAPGGGVSTKSETLPDRSSQPGKPQNSDAENLPRSDPRFLPKQVIYHFAIGDAVPDPRVEA